MLQGFPTKLKQLCMYIKWLLQNRVMKFKKKMFLFHWYLLVVFLCAMGKFFRAFSFSCKLYVSPIFSSKFAKLHLTLLLWLILVDCWFWIFFCYLSPCSSRGMSTSFLSTPSSLSFTPMFLIYYSWTRGCQHDPREFPMFGKRTDRAFLHTFVRHRSCSNDHGWALIQEGSRPCLTWTFIFLARLGPKESDADS